MGIFQGHLGPGLCYTSTSLRRVGAAAGLVFRVSLGGVMALGISGCTVEGLELRVG